MLTHKVKAIINESNSKRYICIHVLTYLKCFINKSEKNIFGKICRDDYAKKYSNKVEIGMAVAIMQRSAHVYALRPQIV